MNCESIYHEVHEHEDGPLIERAHAIQEMAERHYHPDTSHIGKDDYDLLMKVADDLHHADFLMTKIHEFGHLITALQPPSPMFVIEHLGGGNVHPTS